MLPMDLGKVYTFSTLAPSILGTIIKNVRLKSVTDFEDASKHQQLWLQYQNVYPHLPVGTPESPKDSMYYHFETEAKERLILSEFWIDESTIELITTLHYQIDIPIASVGDAARIRNALNSLGITGYSINQI